MANKNEYYTIGVKVSGAEDFKQITVAARDFDSAQEQLKETLGESVSEFKKLDTQQKAHLKYTRQMAVEGNKSARVIKQLNAQLNLEKQLTNATAEEQAILNNLHRLGASATEAQRKEVVELTRDLYKLNAAQDAANDSAGGSGFFTPKRSQVATNVGFQVQDIAVQAGAGTAGNIIAAQQLPQILGALAMGTGGAAAVVLSFTGAIVGLAAAFAPMIAEMISGKDASDEFTTAQESLNEVFEETHGIIPTLSEDFKELYNTNRELAELQLAKAMINANKVLATSGARVRSLNNETLGYLETARGIQDDFKVGEVVAKQIQEARLAFKQTGDVQAYSDSLNELALASDSVELIEFAENIHEVAIATELAESQVDALKTATEDLGVVSTVTAKMLAEQIKTYDEILTVEKDRLATLGMTTEALDYYTFWTQQAGTMTADQIQSVLAAKDAYWEEKNAIDAAAAATKAKTKADKDAAKQAKADRDAAQAQAISDEAQFNATVMKLRKQFLSENEAIMNQIDELYAESSVEAEALDSVLDTTMMLSEALDRRLITEKEFHKLSEMAWDEYNANIAKEQEALTTTELDAQARLIDGATATASIMANQMSSIVDLMSMSGEEISEQTEDMNSAQKAMFLFTQSIAAANALVLGMEMGSKLANNAALLDYTGASSAAMMEFGTALGATQAGAIMGVTFAGAFDKGGSIPTGQMGVVSEFGDELVGGTLVYNQSGSPLAVTGREKTAELMSGESGNSNAVNVTQKFYISGNPDQQALQSMQRMADQAQTNAYSMVNQDFKNDRGISKKAARRR